MPWGEQGGAEPPLGGRCRSGPAGCEAPAASPKDPGRGGPHPNKEWPWSECANPQPLPIGQWEKKEGRQGVGGGGSARRGNHTEQRPQPQSGCWAPGAMLIFCLDCVFLIRLNSGSPSPHLWSSLRAAAPGGKVSKCLRESQVTAEG